MSQLGLVVGLSMTVKNTVPGLGEQIYNIIIGSVLVFEIIGAADKKHFDADDDKNNPDVQIFGDENDRRKAYQKLVGQRIVDFAPVGYFISGPGHSTIQGIRKSGDGKNNHAERIAFNQKQDGYERNSKKPENSQVVGNDFGREKFKKSGRENFIHYRGLTGIILLLLRHKG